MTARDGGLLTEIRVWCLVLIALEMAAVRIGSLECCFRLYSADFIEEITLCA